MADKNNFKMLYFIFSFLLVINSAFSFVINNKEGKCGCYDVCEKNFTRNSIRDMQKIPACQRGCRFYSLVLHTSHEGSPAKNAAHAKQGCLLSCYESYTSQFDELSSCNFGCSAMESLKLCSVTENQIPQFSYSFVIEESDVLIHPGEPDPDDSLTDPGLRKQFQKTLVALLDATPKIPEIHFRNLPIRTEKVSELSQSSFKCPKFYGLDSKLEFRNGKIIIGDLYLFVGVFIFLVICFILGHHIETKNMAKQLMETRLAKKEDLSDREPLLKVQLDQGELVEKERLPPDYTSQKSDIYDPTVNGSDLLDSKFDSITLVFDDDNTSKDNQTEKNSIKI